MYSIWASSLWCLLSLDIQRRWQHRSCISISSSRYVFQFSIVNKCALSNVTVDTKRHVSNLTHLTYIRWIIRASLRHVAKALFDVTERVECQLTRRRHRVIRDSSTRTITYRWNHMICWRRVEKNIYSGECCSLTPDPTKSSKSAEPKASGVFANSAKSRCIVRISSRISSTTLNGTVMHGNLPVARDRVK